MFSKLQLIYFSLLVTLAMSLQTNVKLGTEGKGYVVKTEETDMKTATVTLPDVPPNVTEPGVETTTTTKPDMKITERCIADIDNAIEVLLGNPSTSLVWDGKQYNLILQKPDGSDSQIWILKPSTNDNFIIKNKASGKVLDVEHGATCNSANIILWDETNSLNQQWYIEEGFLNSAVSKQNDSCHMVAGALEGSYIVSGMKIILQERAFGNEGQAMLVLTTDCFSKK